MPTWSSVLSRQNIYWFAGLSTVLYIFGPTIFDYIYYWNPFQLLQSSSSDPDMLMLRRRKKVGRYTVGLTNPANDCFANSNLQSLAALQSLYSYLSEFEHLIPQNEEYEYEEDVVQSDGTVVKEKKTKKRQQPSTGRLTKALAQMIRKLNEPILTPKTMSPWELLRVLEGIYNSHISRSQHDAHELLHLILETLQIENDRLTKLLKADDDANIPEFSFNGSTKDTITCSKCGYSPPATPSTFLVLSLMVPQKRSAYLTDLLEQQCSPEYIQDYGCSSCRLNHLLTSPSTPEDLKAQLKKYVPDPSSLPDELEAKLPKNITSPISKATTFHKLPQVLSIHLSRSIYGGLGASRNSCKISVQETLELYESAPPTTARAKSFFQQHNNDTSASSPSLSSSSSSASNNKPSSSSPASSFSSTILDKRKVTYKLVAMIRHKGTHQHGHYECFRKKNLTWWNSTLLGNGGSFSNSISIPTGYLSAPAPSSPAISIDSSTTNNETRPPPTPPPQLDIGMPQPPPPIPRKPSYYTRSISFQPPNINGSDNNNNSLPYPAQSSPSPASISTSDVTGTTSLPGDNNSNNNDTTTSSAASSIRSKTTNNNSNKPPTHSDVLPPSNYQWWKISDDKVWECSLKDVLKEESGAYLLFYERV